MVVSRSLACPARALASFRRSAGRGWPSVTSRATSARRRVEDRAAPPQALKGGLGVQLFPAHDDPFGLLDQPTMLQRGLQLIGQAPLGLGGGYASCHQHRSIGPVSVEQGDLGVLCG